MTNYMEAEVKKLDENLGKKIKKKFDSLGKPLDGLGVFEDVFCKIGMIQGSTEVELSPAAVAVFCGDHGIIARGVSQSDESVTYQVAKGLAAGTSTVCIMAKAVGADVIPVNVGMKYGVDFKDIENKLIRGGTRNFVKEPAMTIGEAMAAISVGFEKARALKEAGYKIILAGEMGIGNTTSSAAIISTLLRADPERLCGRGAGLSDEGLREKIAVIKEARAIWNLNSKDVMTIFSTLGGYEIAALVGLFIGGAAFGIPVVSDGLVSGTAAFVAAVLRPEVEEYIIFSQDSREPGAKRIISEFGAKPPISADVSLGEGTGGVLFLSLLAPVKKYYDEGATFDDIDVEQYERF